MLQKSCMCQGCQCFRRASAKAVHDTALHLPQESSPWLMHPCGVLDTPLDDMYLWGYWTKIIKSATHYARNASALEFKLFPHELNKPLVWFGYIHIEVTDEYHQSFHRGKCMCVKFSMLALGVFWDMQTLKIRFHLFSVCHRPVLGSN